MTCISNFDYTTKPPVPSLLLARFLRLPDFDGDTLARFVGEEATACDVERYERAARRAGADPERLAIAVANARAEEWTREFVNYVTGALSAMACEVPHV